MTKKSKKFKKSKLKNSAVLKANEIENYIRIKYDIDDNGFWLWFFEKSDLGETNFLSLNLDDINNMNPSFKDYLNILKEDFSSDADSENYLEIENDL